MLEPEKVCLSSTNFNFKNQRSLYHGKVRDVYDLGEELLMITTDRISAFDCILPRPIPYKGQVLNQIACYFLDAVKDICPVWLKSSPDPNVSIGIKCRPVPIELVVRGFLAGHAWRTYKSGKRELCGVTLPEGMQESDEFPVPIITPTTKASAGHDEDISYEDILNKEIISKSELDKIYDISLKLFRRGQDMAAGKGLILVDTKYEFGYSGNELVLMDEIHTPDSSRYFLSEGYHERQQSGVAQIQLSKEFVREWLMSHGFQGKDGQLMPHMPDSFVWEISRRYIELFEKITGKIFEKPVMEDVKERIGQHLVDLLA
ncbi:MAG: phosphoribosylaminoimidazolesuccinocarboxamide synthase [Saprospiraceae bacterium]|nr:phosphoribosylaminoimidazolesuccinocarboxamide synthase [Candidatus Vicinibacter affinis]MBP6523263.1 phosphoribosylaminoimidazolesuccinocarboxamide synthase [Saprospiraceae bacterium]